MNQITERVKKNPRVIMAVANIIFLALPWVEAEANVNILGYGASAGSTVSGFDCIKEGGFSMILVLLLSCAFILVEFIPNLQSKQKVIYLIGSIAGIILSIIASSAGGDVDTQTVEGVLNVEIGRKIGFWLEILCFAVIGGYTVKKERGSSDK